jgi:hypothetical protein
MRHATIRLTADLYTDLGLEDAAGGTWELPELGIGTAQGTAEPRIEGFKTLDWMDFMIC